MARQVHTIQTFNALYSTTGKNLTMVAADVTNDEEVAHNGKIFIVAQNTDVSAHTVTVNSTPLNGRTGDISAHSIPAAGVCLLGPFPNAGWSQTTGLLLFEANDATVKFAVVTLPA